MTFKEINKNPGPGLSYIAGFLSASSIVGAVIFLAFRDVHETHVQTLALITTGVITMGGVVYQVRSTKARQEEEKADLISEKAMALYSSFRALEIHADFIVMKIREGRDEGKERSMENRISDIFLYFSQYPVKKIYWTEKPDLVFGLHHEILRGALNTEIAYEMIRDFTLRWKGTIKHAKANKAALQLKETKDIVAKIEDLIIMNFETLVQSQKVLAEVYKFPEFKRDFRDQAHAVQTDVAV